MIRQKLEDKIVADATKRRTAAPGQRDLHRQSRDRPRRRRPSRSATSCSRPKDDPQRAQRDLPAHDPAWAKAKADAEAAYAKLKADPTLFDVDGADRERRGAAPGATPAPAASCRLHRRRRAVRPRTSRTRSSSRASSPASCSRRSRAPSAGTCPGHVPRRRTRPGWPSSRPRPTAARTSPSSPATTPRPETAGKGGDLGWVARASSTDALTDAIFAAPVGKTQRDRHDRRRRDVPLQGPRRGGPDAGGPAARGIKANAFANWYTAKKAAVEDRARPVDHADQRGLASAACSTRSSPRRGCAGGSTRPRASRSSRPSGSSATPIEPSRPVLIVPLASLRSGATASRRPSTPLPGAHGPGGDDPLAVLRRLYPADHPVGRFGAADGDDDRRARRRRPRRAAATSRPLAPERPSPGRGRCPGSATGCARPTAVRGTASRPTHRCASTCSRRPTRSTTRSRAARRPELAGELGDLLLQVVLHAQLAAEEGVFDLTDVQAALAAKIVRRHPHVFGDAEARDRVGRQPPVGADQGRRSARTPAR